MAWSRSRRVGAKHRLSTKQKRIGLQIASCLWTPDTLLFSSSCAQFDVWQQSTLVFLEKQIGKEKKKKSSANSWASYSLTRVIIWNSVCMGNSFGRSSVSFIYFSYLTVKNNVSMSSRFSFKVRQSGDSSSLNKTWPKLECLLVLLWNRTLLHPLGDVVN